MHVFWKNTALVAATLAPLSLGGGAGAQTPPPPPNAGPPPGDPLGPDLFIAIRSGTVEDVKAALAKGAKTEATNWLGITPLMWAALIGNQPACEALLAGGAKINAPSRYGNALALAEMGGSTPLVRFLLERGAKLTKDRADGITPLMSAADSGRLEAIRLLLDAGADVSASDNEGATALHFAARRGKTAAARLLLDAGANVKAQDGSGRTALMYAAKNGYAACAALLLGRGAPVNARDRTGNTALLLAARYADDPEVARTLVRAGADPFLQNAGKRAPFEVAFARRAAQDQDAAALPKRARQAAERGLALIERSTKTFSSQAACTSCHHQGLGLMATGLARERGFRYDRMLAGAEVGKVVKFDDDHIGEMRAVLPNPEMYKHIPTVDMGEFAVGASFLYSGLLAHGVVPGEAQTANIVVLAAQQDPSGRWGFYLRREPVQSSAFATTALAVRLLKAYMPKDRAEETARRVEQARKWLLATPARTGDDRAYKLLGLKWAGADAQAVATAAKDLQSVQRADGGWAQMPSDSTPEGDAYTRSDAYATGLALYALHQGGGLAASAPAYQRGVRYLLQTQDEDGSWFVGKRAIPANNYFDADFPHGESQYISYSATCWASMALMLAAEPGKSSPALAQKAMHAH